jgi:DhnA family fructose-bisphosphate aldolase class Ia
VSAPLAADGRIVVVAVDHPLYSWPCAGLEDRAGTIRTVVEAGADAIIAAYGTVRDVPEAIGAAAPILKLDVTTVTVGGDYPLTEYVTAYSVDDAQRVGAAAVLTFVQLGADFELDALRTAGQVAAAADRAGLPYVCEIMPVESLRFPDPYDPGAIAAATRTAVELGAHVVKTSMRRRSGCRSSSPGGTSHPTVTACWVPWTWRCAAAPAAWRSAGTSGARRTPPAPCASSRASCTLVDARRSPASDYQRPPSATVMASPFTAVAPSDVR